MTNLDIHEDNLTLNVHIVGLWDLKSLFRFHLHAISKWRGKNFQLKELSEDRAFVLGFAFGDGEGWSDDRSPSCVCVYLSLGNITSDGNNKRETRERKLFPL